MTLMHLLFNHLDLDLDLAMVSEGISEISTLLFH